MNRRSFAAKLVGLAAGGLGLNRISTAANAGPSLARMADVAAPLKSCSLQSLGFAIPDGAKIHGLVVTFANDWGTTWTEADVNASDFGRKI